MEDTMESLWSACVPLPEKLRTDIPTVISHVGDRMNNVYPVETPNGGIALNSISGTQLREVGLFTARVFEKVARSE
jgi:hypothetical protein